MQNIFTISRPKIDILSFLSFRGLVYSFSGIGKGESTAIFIATLSVGVLSLLLFLLR